ncbi:hypothetical protein KJ359_008306 [Pestalotiopsis sp. 9143b]|nr:hypothetical protein KJ359_008306 [Pestalotiopsis sp. 9143b]
MKKNKLFNVLPLSTTGLYKDVPTHDFDNSPSPFDSPLSSKSWRNSKLRWHIRRPPSVKRIFTAGAALFLIIILGLGSFTRWQRYMGEAEMEGTGPRFHWERYPGLHGFYNGVRSIVKLSQWIPQQRDLAQTNYTIHDDIPVNPVMADPYHFSSAKYLQEHYAVNTCYMDEEDTVPAPDVFALPGIPAYTPAPEWGTYENLGLAPDLCWERFGRLGPYGYSYPQPEGGLGLSRNSEHVGADKVTDLFDKVDYRNMDWGKAQKRCFERNKHRFDPAHKPTDKPAKKQVSRTAFVMRTYSGYQYGETQIVSMRAMINELSLKSGGEYDVHLLVHIKDNTIPIWASDEIYQEQIRINVPEEFWGITTLWSEPLMRLYYPNLVSHDETFENMSGGDIYGVYRSAHFALQWFSQKHQEYDFFWNWEMDVRYSGHHYEFHHGVSQWADKQPRKLLWERSQRFWIPALHGSWDNFTQMVEEETKASGEAPVWGPVKFDTGDRGMVAHPDGTEPPTSFDKDNYEWGVGEPTDLIVFDPFFDAAKSSWVFRLDITGYDQKVKPPPRRTSIVTIARLSKRLLNVMHEETYRTRHSMFPEMFPPSMALHHGLKAAYAPHPVYFDRKWPLDILDRTFNRPQNPQESPFGGGEHNMKGASFYYDAGFSGALWRRWLGLPENGEGGREYEERNSGRMCLRGSLHHPIKWDGVEN